MHEYLEWLFSWLREEAIVLIHNSHDYFWNGNSVFFVFFIVSLVIILNSKGEKSNAKKLIALFSIVIMLGVCYNPFLFMLMKRIPGYSESVFSRVWIMLPVWLIIALAATEVISRVQSTWMRNSFGLVAAAALVLFGISPDTLGYYTELESKYKVKAEGVEISEVILSNFDGDSAGVLVFTDSNGYGDSFVQGGTTYSAIEQFSGKIKVYPVIVSEQEWNDNYLSFMTEDGKFSFEYINDRFNIFRRWYDFQYVAMPFDSSMRIKMLFSGYQFIASVNGTDIYMTEKQFKIQTFSNYMENKNKIYVISDNVGHFIIVGGGSKTDRRQLQEITALCGNHIDAWIMPAPSAENLEGFNYIVSSGECIVDSVYLPAMDNATKPQGFMDEQDSDAYEVFLSLSNKGLFELSFVKDNDEIELYGIVVRVFSDMLDIQSGDVNDNSMLFSVSTGDESFLFCSYMGYEQGQIAIQKHGADLASDYIQIASGSGDGLGLSFYNTVNPKIAFCDSIVDDAGLETYNLLKDSGVTCYCFENGDPNWVIIE